MRRQGDLIFLKIDKLPKELKKVPSRVIVRGESTNHSHRLVGGDVFSGKDGLLYLVLDKAGKIVHEEHSPIKLSKGLWAAKRQKEYLSKDMARIVTD